MPLLSFSTSLFVMPQKLGGTTFAAPPYKTRVFLSKAIMSHQNQLCGGSSPNRKAIEGAAISRAPSTPQSASAW